MSDDEREQQVSPEDEPEDLDVSDGQADEVQGGLNPPPGGPQPIAYPN